MGTAETFTIVEREGGFSVVYESGGELGKCIDAGGKLFGPYKQRVDAEARIARYRDRICDVCGSDCCGSEHVDWELYGVDEGLVRAGHAMEEAMIDYICYSQMFDLCDRNNFDNAKVEIDESRDRAIERLRQRRAKVQQSA